MTEEFSPAVLNNIAFMVSISKDVPEDFFMIAAMQVIAELVDRNEDVLDDSDKAILLGIGALLIKEGRAEAMAGIEAMLAFGKAARGL